MLLIHDYIDERKARLVRLGARECQKCVSTQSALAEKDKSMAAQAASIVALKVRIMAMEEYIKNKLVKPPVADTPSFDEIPKVRIEDIIFATCKHYNIRRIEIMTRRRCVEFVFPRQVALYLARRLTTSSLPVIGGAFCGMDHTTVLHAARKVTALLETSEELRAAIEKIVLDIRMNCAERAAA